jgi:excisionase family DNA binding protein
LAALPTFLSMDEAAHQLGVSESRLRRMIESGKIKAAIIGEETVVSQASINKFHKQQPISQPSGIRKEDLKEYRKFSHLTKKIIWLSEAERIYNVPAQTISTWVHKGFIAKVGQEKNRILLSEQDVAYCAEIYHSHKGQGKWLFNSDGTPYILRSEKAQLPA